MLFDEEPPVIVPNWTREMWVLDPGPFTDIAFDLGVENFVFRAKLHEMPNMRQDFTKFIDMFARGRRWNVIWTPYPGDWAVLFTSERGWNKPAAVWRIWRAGTMKLSEMTRLFETIDPPGTTLGHFGTFSRGHANPVNTVEGQEHRVLCANIPHDQGQWGEIATHAQQLQATDPARTLHFHGQKSVGRTIGIAAKSFDHPVRIDWISGFPRILLPNGMLWDTAKEPSPFIKQWLRIVGTKPSDFENLERKELARLTYRTNLKSLRWAFLNWDRAWDFRREVPPDEIESSEIDWTPKALPIRLRKTKKENMELDRWLCDTCSLQLRCPYSREGAVCILPDSEPAELATYFKTRNGHQIVEALGNVLSAMAARAQRALRQETAVIEAHEEDPDSKPDVILSPELTKLMNSVFDRGVQLAKLVDPTIAHQMSSRVNLNFSLTASNTPMTSQALHGYVAAQLQARGIDMKDATEEMIAEILSEAGGHQAIEASATEVHREN